MGRATQATLGSRPAAGAGGRGRGILRTRLLPPRLPRECLARHDLIERVLEGLHGRAVALIASAGYGKTTLLAQTVAQLTTPWIWLSCDERLGGSRAFLSHLAAGVGERFPGVASALDLGGRPEEAVAKLANEILATIGEDFVVVLDDVHALAGRPAARALGLLLSDLPPTAHLAIASRSALTIPTARLRATGVVELGESALALSEDEAAELLASLRLPVPPAMLAALHRRTEGWPAGLVLAAQSGALVAEGDRQGLGEGHAAYLAEEILARQSPEVRAFLLETSLLERFTPMLAEAVTARADARRTIADLVAGHLFVVRLAAGGEWYRYHHLFGAFLRARLAESYGADTIRALHARAGHGWMAAGEPVEALHHLLAAGDPGRTVEAIEPVAEAIVTGAEADALADWLDRIPVDLRAGRPGLTLAHAWLLLSRSEHEAAFAALERAIDELITAGEHERAAMAFCRLLAGLSATGADPHRRGLEARRRFLSRLDPGTRMLPAARIMLATSFAYACRYEEAEEELQAALALPEAARFPALPVYAEVNRAFFIDHYQGRSRRALAALDAAIAWLEAHRSEDELAYLPWAHGYRGVLLGHLGRWHDALRAAERWELAGRASGLASMAGTESWMRFEALVGLGRWEGLQAGLAHAAPLAQRLPGSLFAMRHHVGAAQLAAQRGDAAGVTARIAAVLGRDLPRFYRAMLVTDLATAAGRVGLVEHARDLLASAREDAREARAPWALARAALLGADLAAGDAEADALLGQALEASASLEDGELWSGRERRRAAGLLARAIDAGLGPPGVASGLLAECGGEVLSEAAARLASARPAARAALAAVAGRSSSVEPSLVRRLLADRDPLVRDAARDAQRRRAGLPRPPIKIATLGGFTVSRAGCELPLLAGGRGGKTRVLLAILAAAEGPVHREALLEWLWPRLPQRRGLAALHTALHALRQALEPDPAGRAPTLVVTEGETYRLALAEDDEFDVAVLRRLAETGSSGSTAAERLDALLAAEAADAGPYLPEWPYEDWAAPRRRDVERLRREILERLADTLLAAGEARAAASRYLRLLDDDPEREQWHRGLMLSYAAADEPGLALRQFHACRTLLRERLGIEPSAQTRALYASLL